MLEAIFESAVDEITVSGLMQWDKGQQLKSTLEDAPGAFEVHFARKRSNVAEVVEVTYDDEYTVVNIPNDILRHPCDAIAYVYYTDGEAGKTVKVINLPIKPRAKPEDYIYSEDDVMGYAKILNMIDSVTGKVYRFAIADGEVYINEVE